MSKVKTINSSTEAMTMMIQRDIITATGVYKAVKSTPSRMDDTSAHFIEYSLY